jgi:hypothetical protein
MDKSDEPAVRKTVEKFLGAAGSNDLDAIERMVLPNANVGWVSLSDGKWTSGTMSIQEWVAEARSRSNPTIYTEPVTNWTVHVDGGRLAFVRADALWVVGNSAERRNIDYFTLIKTDGAWKFLSLSYLGRPTESE